MSPQRRFKALRERLPHEGSPHAPAAVDAAGLRAAGAEREAFIDGIALWTPAWPGWALAAAALRGEPASSTATVPPHGRCETHADEAGEGRAHADPAAGRARPNPAGLAPNERRRAPDSVRVALHVAEQAAAMSGHAVATLPSVFTSAHGDLRIVDGLLRTLAGAPQLLSPTRFHHAVHNAPSGYWAMASGSHAASSALAGYDHSFGAGLLEALVQLATEERALLLVGCDTEAQGALASVNASRGLLGVALVLAPRPGPRTQFALRWRLGAFSAPGTGAADQTAAIHKACTPAARALARNALGDALPLLEALARGGASTLALRCGPALALQVALQPWGQAG